MTLPGGTLLAATRGAFAGLDADAVQRWAGRGFWAVTDQALFAGSSFLLNVLLARWLSPAQYGSFAVGFAIFLFISAAYTAFATEPMLVFGSGKYESRFRSYLGLLIVTHVVIMGLVGVAVMAGGLLLSRLRPGALMPVVAAMGAASPVILLQWLLRRACYVRLHPRTAAAAGVLHLVAMALGLVILQGQQLLSPASAILLLGGASVISIAWLLASLRPSFGSLRRDALKREALRDHWLFGRWAVGTNGVSWARNNIYYLVLPLWIGLEGSAVLKAVVNLIQPVEQASTALGQVVMPLFARRRGRKGFSLLVLRVTLLMMLGALAYWVALQLLSGSIIGWLYGGKYAGHRATILILGLIPVLRAVSVVLGAALKALERPDMDFWSHALSAVVAVTVGLVMARVWGVGGAAAGWLASFGASAVALIILYRSSVTSSPGTSGTTAT